MKIIQMESRWLKGSVLRYSSLIILMTLFGCSTLKKTPKRGTDFHMHIHSPGEEYDDVEFSGERALFAADSIGLSRALILSNAYSQNVTETYTHKENDFVISEASRNKNQLAGACSVNPKKDWARTEVQRCASKGVKVIKLHLMASGLDLKKDSDYKIAKNVIKEAQTYNLTVIVHANYPRSSRGNEIDKLVDLINEFPNTRWIIGHAFGREYRALLNIKHKNFFVETSVAPVWCKTDQERNNFVETIRLVGIEKFVFGSDWPVLHPAENLKALNSLQLTDTEMMKILFENAGQLDDLFMN